MSDFLTFMVLTAAFGLAIFLSLPIVYWRRAQGGGAVFLNAGAIGILVFLLADIFSDVSPILYPAGYVANLTYTAVFTAAFVGAFVLLFIVDSETVRTMVGAKGGVKNTAFIIALGIGLQNLTEGLVFGVTWRSGALAGLLLVIFVGFFLQNVTEGFPIASPFLGTDAARGIGLMSALFLLGGVPTLLGGALGYVYGASDLALVAFDALAIGAITYAVLPMLRVAFRPLESREASVRRNQLVYLGIMIGFAVGFLVNAI